MKTCFNVAIIGLDTSHATEFPKLMQDPASKLKIPELHATRCLSFETPFQNAEGLKKRAEYLESIGVKVVTDFDEAVKDCDAILLEINDPVVHLEYFKKAAVLGKPVFLDKPFADSVENAREILRIAKENHIRFYTASSLRFAYEFAEAMKDTSFVTRGAVTWGPVGKAPEGRSSVIWYGVHAVEMLQRALGCGAETVSAVEDSDGYVVTVTYNDGRRGVVLLSRTRHNYGALLQSAEEKNKLVEVSYEKQFYYYLLLQILEFLKTGEQVVEHADSFEIMAILEAIEHSVRTGKICKIEKLEK